MSFKLEDAPSQSGRIAIVTGANIGLGYETTIGLVKKGAKVIMACRNQSKADNAKAAIEKTVPGAELEVMILDLNSLTSVRSFVKTYTNNYDRLDLLINNAGLMIPPLMRTEDGFESQMGVNHFGHFLLTNLLFPTLEKTGKARVVTLSSNAHKSGKINFENLNAENDYSRMGAYSMSKLACLMFAYELDRRIETSGSSVTAVSAHPGVSNTNLGQYVPRWLYTIFLPLEPLFMHSVENAALPSLYAALGTDVNGGDYFGPTGFSEMKGKPGKVTSKPQSHDKVVAGRLWEVSEELTGAKFNV